MSLGKSETITKAVQDTSRFVENLQKVGAVNVRNVDKFAKAFGDVDASVIKAAKDLKAGTITLDDFNKTAQSATNTTNAFGATLKSVVANIGIMLAINWVIKGAVALWDSYVNRVENAREALEETTSEMESVESEIKNINKQIDELLAKETPTLTDEQDLKRLQAENKELSNRLKLLEAQKELETQELNDAIEKDYKRDWVNKRAITWEGTGEYATDAYGREYEIHEEVVHNRENEFYNKIEALKEYASLERELTEQEKADFEEKRSLIIAEGTELSNLTESYIPVTQAQHEMYNTWQQMIADAAEVTDMYPGSAMDAITRLYEKFATNGYLSTGKGSRRSNNTPFKVDVNNANIQVQEDIKSWIDNLDEDERKIMLECELEGASLEELKEYLNSKMEEIQDDVNKIDYSTLTNQYESVSDSAKSLRSAISDLNNAFAEQNENGSISMDTMLKLVENGYATALSFDEATGACTINKDAMLDLVQAKIQDQITSLYLLKIDLANKLYEDGVAASKSAEGFIALAEAKLADAEATALEQKQSIEQFNNLEAQIKALKNVSKNVESIGLGNYGKDVVKDAKDYIKSYMEFQKRSLEKGVIDYNTYCNTVSNLLKDMFKQGKISAEDFHSYTKQMLEEQKSIYDKALNAIIRRFDKEIEKIDDAIEAIEKQNKALEKQKDEYDKILSVIDSVYSDEIESVNAQKDALQDKIDALREEADAYDLIRRREQALYALEQAQNQRVKKVYNGTQFVYETDQSAIREAQDNLQSIENEKIISMLEKEQEILDKSIESLEKYRDIWAEISNARETEQNRQMAIALYGENYESIILQNRLSDIESFKNNYVSIQKQIDNNDSVIASYEEKIKYYENLKQEWADIADAYENSISEQYATMILGQDWEKTIFDERRVALNTFKEDYVQIQKAIAQSAWDSANEQVKAAEVAMNALNGLNNAEKITIEYETRNNTNVQSFGSSNISGSVKKDPHTKVAFYHDGLESGYVGDSAKSKDKRLRVLQQAGRGELLPNEELDVLQKEELVLTKPQQINIVEKLMQNPMVIKPNITLPDYSRLSNVVTKQQPIEQHNQFNVSLPNITDGSKAEKLFKELQQLPLDALQHSYRR